MNQHTYKNTHTLEDGRHLTEDGKQSTEDGKQSTEDGKQSLGLSLYVDQNNIPVIAILADHFEVPSRTLCLTAFICPA